MIKVNFFLLIMVLFGTGSCGKWLDVRPEHEIFVDDALKDRIGFVKALSGIYKQLADPDLYGRELKFGMLDAMAGYWSMSPGHEYYQIKQFNFQHQDFQKRRDAIWQKMYSAIHQCNMLLADLDNIKGDAFYNLIKGEILGLRAYIHFELFKLFGPVTTIKGMDTPAIPYYLAVSKVPLEFSTSKTCLKYIENDLLEAKSLLMEDPIIKQGRSKDGNPPNEVYNELLDRRGIRMNYYAVMALLVRQAQWEADWPKAIERGEALLTALHASNAVRLIDSADILPNGAGDKRWTVENLWGLYVKDMRSNMTGRFTGQLVSTTALYTEYLDFLDKIYIKGSGSLADYRNETWNVKDLLVKFTAVSFTEESTSEGQAQNFEMQLINLPEIYLILTESYLDKNIYQALDKLNTLRLHRGLPKIAEQASLTASIVKGYLIDEVRREYIGEGYLFSFYKRLYNPVYRRGTNIQPSESIFVWPLPANENIFNPQ